MLDLDGTLLDTVPDLAVAANAMLLKLGRRAVDESALRTFVGKGIPRFVERALAGSLEGRVDRALLEDALPEFERCYREVNGRHATIYPGVREGLDAFMAAGFPLACVTNKAERFTSPLLESMGLARYFQCLVAGDTLPVKKPDPGPLLHACRQFGIEPRAMLMIGDSVNDAEAARAAGSPIFCVDYGYNEGRDVRELDVDAIVASIFDATRLIKKA
jgi:phosphoglycolate phosphatase